MPHRVSHLLPAWRCWLLPASTGYSGKRFIFEKCKELGVKALVLDAPDSWAQLMEGEGVISKFIPIDFADAEHAFDNCLKVPCRAQP